jgi:hypothetical protein
MTCSRLPGINALSGLKSPVREEIPVKPVSKDGWELPITISVDMKLSGTSLLQKNFEKSRRSDQTTNPIRMNSNSLSPAQYSAPLKVFLLLPSLLIAIALSSCGLIGTALMAKAHFGCIPEGVRIDTPKGPVAIENLKSGDAITGFEGKPVYITQIHQYQEDPTTSQYLTVHFTNGSQVTTSLRHRIAGVPAIDLKPGDVCDSQTVSTIEPVHGVSRSFDLLTEDSGYRITGIPVNSMIEEMRKR